MPIRIRDFPGTYECPDVYSWARDHLDATRTVTLLGKGPSFSLVDHFDLSGTTVVGLNHVVLQRKVDIAHAIDIDVVERCEDVLFENADWMLMPICPHINCRPTNLRLWDFISTVPILREFADRGRLVWYSLWSGPSVENLPKVQGTFSGSILVHLLSGLGVKHVQSLGVDGGKAYSHDFASVSEESLFKNGHESFDVQFEEIAAVTNNTDLVYQSMAETIRVFVGCEDSQMIAAQVLAHSIRKHTDHPVDIFFMNNSAVRQPRDSANRPGTGFSFNRFLIPRLCGFEGKAIYLDADMLVFEDIVNLWRIPFDGATLLCSSQTEVPRGWEDGKNNSLGEGRYWTPGRQLSVMLLDCASLNWDPDVIVDRLDAGEFTYKELMAELCIVDTDDVRDTIPNTWNCLEWYEPGTSALVHFTVVPTQPWSSTENALQELWESEFVDAVRAGAVDVGILEASAKAGHVRSALVDIAQAVETDVPVKEGDPVMRPEASIRHQLWAAWIERNSLNSELNRIKGSPAFWLENNLIRRPAYFFFRAGRWLLRKLSR